MLNLIKNGMVLGLKKTLGKIFQPLNSYTRFPEYYFCSYAIEQFIKENNSKSLKFLDIGSPKLFGLYLAYRYDIKLYLTDISRLNLDEYLILWKVIKNGAKGQVVFIQQDGRALSYPNGQFDIVYSMSVVEHIEGEAQDTKVVSEIERVLKPGGQLVISVPFGNIYMEQVARGFSHATEAVNANSLYFFQRIYNEEAIQSRLIAPLQTINSLKSWTVYRKNSFFTHFYHQFRRTMGENINGLLGFLNPVMSLWLNCHQPGRYTDFLTSYQPVHTLKDIYGDLILAWRKPH